jgi:hypothetical protein
MIIEKIIKIRNEVKVGKTKENDHKKYKYFDPEAITDALDELYLKYRIYDKFSLIFNPTKDKYEARLQLTDLEDDTTETFEFDIPLAQIAGANDAQNAGGTLTYGKRYSQMNAFNIVDERDDLDHTNNTKPQGAKPWEKPKGNTTAPTPPKATTTAPQTPTKEEELPFKKAVEQPTQKPQQTGAKMASPKQVETLINLQTKGRLPSELIFKNPQGDVIVTMSEASEMLDFCFGKNDGYSYNTTEQDLPF